jgi:hypothetical protein
MHGPMNVRFILRNCSLTIHYRHIIRCYVVADSVVKLWVEVWEYPYFAIVYRLITFYKSNKSLSKVIHSIYYSNVF